MAAELRVRLFTTHFAPFYAAAFASEASSGRKKCAVTIFCAVLIVVPAEDGNRTGRFSPGQGDLVNPAAFSRY
jgi:hypothetical protein